MSAEQYDKDITEATDWFIAEMTKLNAVWQAKVESIMADPKHKDVPDHLAAASLKAAVAKIESAAADQG